MISIQWINTEEFGFISGLLIWVVIWAVVRFLYLNVWGLKKMQQAIRGGLSEFRILNTEFQDKFQIYRETILRLRPNMYKLVIDGEYTEEFLCHDIPMDNLRDSKNFMREVMIYLQLHTFMTDLDYKNKPLDELKFGHDVPNMQKINNLYNRFKEMYSVYYELYCYSEVLIDRALRCIPAIFRVFNRERLKRLLGIWVLPENQVVYRLNAVYKNSGNKVVLKQTFRFDEQTLKALKVYAEILTACNSRREVSNIKK